MGLQERNPIISNKEKSVVYTTSLDMKDPAENAKHLKSRRRKVLACIMYQHFAQGCSYSLMAPFFPAEAEHKGATATQYGLIFGVYSLVIFVTAPIFGKLAPKLNAGFLISSGMCVSGVCAILFGFLVFASPGIPFIATAFAVRSVDALGVSAFATTAFAILACEIPEDIGWATALTEASLSCGMAIGPSVGGFIYEAGGFIAPFAVIGCFLLFGAVVSYCLFSDTKIVTQSHASARQLLADPDFLINVANIFSCNFLMGFNEATLEPHIRKFHLSVAAVGAVFLIPGLLDAISSPVWGTFADRMPNAMYLTFFGSTLLIVCVLIIGPVTFLPFTKRLWVVIISQILFGLGTAIAIVGVYTHGMKDILKKGLPDDVSSYSLISGVLFSSCMLGTFVGPALGGYLVDHVGYRKSTTIVFAGGTIIVLITGIRLLCLSIRKNRKETLLDSS